MSALAIQLAGSLIAILIKRLQLDFISISARFLVQLARCQVGSFGLLIGHIQCWLLGDSFQQLPCKPAKKAL